MNEIEELALVAVDTLRAWADSHAHWEEYFCEPDPYEIVNAPRDMLGNAKRDPWELLGQDLAEHVAEALMQSYTILECPNCGFADSITCGCDEAVEVDLDGVADYVRQGESCVGYERHIIEQAMDTLFNAWSESIGIRQLVEDARQAAEDIENAIGVPHEVVRTLLAASHVCHYSGRIFEDHAWDDRLMRLAQFGLSDVFSRDQVAEYLRSI